MFCAIIVALSAVRNSAYSRLNHYSFRNASPRASETGVREDISTDYEENKV